MLAPIRGNAFRREFADPFAQFPRSEREWARAAGHARTRAVHGERGEAAVPMNKEVDATTPRYLRDKYAIAGVGETTYTRGSGRTTRALASWAVRNAILDAGLTPADIDGMLSYQSGDSTFAPFVAGDLGIRLNFYMDVFGGGSSTEALVGIAIGVIEAGLCKTVVIF